MKVPLKISSENKKRVELGNILDEAIDLTFNGTTAVYSIKEEKDILNR